jgi:hypothetical protein
VLLAFAQQREAVFLEILHQFSAFHRHLISQRGSVR